MNRLAVTAGAVLAVWASACGGRGCAGGAKGPADVGPVAADAAVAPSPAPSRMALVDAFGEILPVQVEWVAVFPSKWVADALTVLPEASPKLVRALDREGFVKHVQALYGLDPTTLGTWCMAARIVDAGPLVACDGGAPLSAVEGATRWTDADAPGLDVERGDETIALRNVSGRVVAGSPEALRRALQAARHRVPTLKDAGDRWKKAVRELDGADAWREGAVYWLDPSKAPWCIPGDCRATAAFASRTAFVVTAEAEPGRTEMVRLAAERTWNAVRQEFEALHQKPREERPGWLPDEMFKGGDGVVRSAKVSVRGERVSLAGDGDLAGMAAVLRVDLVRLLVGKLD